MHRVIAIIALTAIAPGLAACGTQPGGYSDSTMNEVTAYYEPSRTVPDYSPRGATGLVSLGIGLF